VTYWWGADAVDGIIGYVGLWRTWNECCTARTG